MVKITGNENVKIVLRAYLRQKWIDLGQSETKNDHRPIILYMLWNFHQRKCFVFVIINLQAIIGLSGRTSCRSGQLAVHLNVEKAAAWTVIYMNK